jgi:hypothetical protein
MPFALMSGRKDGLFSIDLAASHCPLILWLSAGRPASYANVGGCRIQNGNASSLLYVAGTRTPSEPLTFPVEGVDGGSVSMLTVQVG